MFSIILLTLIPTIVIVAILVVVYKIVPRMPNERTRIIIQGSVILLVVVYFLYHLYNIGRFILNRAS